LGAKPVISSAYTPLNLPPHLSWNHLLRFSPLFLSIYNFLPFPGSLSPPANTTIQPMNFAGIDRSLTAVVLSTSCALPIQTGVGLQDFKHRGCLKCKFGDSLAPGSGTMRIVWGNLHVTGSEAPCTDMFIVNKSDRRKKR